MKKRPGSSTEQPTSKQTRREHPPAQRGGRATQNHRGRGRRRGRGRNGNPAPPIREPAKPEASRLQHVVTCSSVLYEGCRSDDFPEHLPNVFRDADHYMRTFLPLLYEEARESIKTTFADGCEQDQCWDAMVEKVDMQGGGWVQLEVFLGRFHGKPSVLPRMFQNMTAILTNVTPAKRDPLESLHQKLKQEKESEGCPPTAVVAVVAQFEREARVLTLRTRPVCDAHLNDPEAPCRQLIENLRRFSEPWILFPTGGIVTQQRECDILHALDKILVMPSLLKPDEALKMKIEDVPRKMPMDLGQGIRYHINQTYDPSQEDAILMCTAHFCKEDNAPGKPTLPVLLIQGPPGTGKTHTVQGILNLWHLVQFERYYKRVIGQYRSAVSEVMKKSELATTRTLMKPRILVCAPSNAAVDELLERILMHGFKDSQGRTYKPNLVRIGAEEANYSDDVRPVLLDTFVSSYMALKKHDWEFSLESHEKRIQVLESEIAELEQQLLADERSVDNLGGVLLSKMEKLDKSETEIRRLRMVECVVNGTCLNERVVKEALELNFLEHAEMVFTTLSSTGRKVLSKVTRGFETVLIDEAAQASEVSALQPLVYGCQQCVLVGDPQQLPATIISQKGKQLNMERSLFARLQEAGAPVKVLQTQYRMHPWIRHFPSSYFYNNMLEDGRNVKERPQELFYDHDLLKPYVVFDVPTGQHERQGGGSLQNQVEANLAAALFKELRDFLIEKQRQALRERRTPPAPVRVGVLTPYRSQTKCLTSTFLRLLGGAVASEVKIMTVDSFQGKQLDVVIFSCVRGSARASGVGFVADIRRMNVAITRARKALWILGNFRTLVSQPAWAALEADAKQRECFVVDSTAQSLFPHQNLFKPKRQTIMPTEQVSISCNYFF